MGKVTDHLLALVQKQVEDRGIVVWYDPDRAYGDVAAHLSFPGAAVLRFEGSFFALREQLEPFLEFVDETGQPKPDVGVPSRVLVYVPCARRDTHFALIEAESAGVVMEPGASPWQRNTRLRVIAERVFKEIAPGRAAGIARQVEQGNLTLADLDRLAEQSATIGAGAVSLIFGTSSPEEVALLFAASEQYDAAIEAKNATPEVLALLSTGLGLDLDPQAHPPQARTVLRRLFLLGDLVAGLPPEAIPSELRSVNLPDRPGHLTVIQQVCRTWRNRFDLRGSYAEAARAVQAEVGVPRFNLAPRVLVDLETFPFIEERLLQHAEECLLAGKSEEVLALAARRKESFWSVQDPLHQIHWSLLETAARLHAIASRILAELKAGKRSPAEMITAYSSGDSPWCLLDTYHRHLERLFSVFDLSVDGPHDRLEQVVHQTRQAYVDVVGSCAEAFSSGLDAADFVIDCVLPQGEVFSRLVTSAAREPGKTAYILVDALRFEMAREMLDGLGDGFEVSLMPAVARLPSVTPVGMAALLPGAERGMELVESGGRVAIRIGSAVLKDRASRIKHLREQVDRTIVDVKLNDLMRPSKNLQEAIAAADLVLVTSQEIDRRGEEAEDEDEAHRYMGEVLEKLRRGLRRLAALGISHMVIAADHGYLFAEALGEDRLLPAPDGREVERHRRVWIGKGGATPPNCMRVPASRVGLAGDLELVWPRGYACFRAGGSRAYLHGGPSLQEMVVPVAVVKARRPAAPAEGPGEVKVEMERPRITTRFFSVTATLVTTGLFPASERRVKVIVRAGGRDIGHAVMAAYGFEEGTQEIVLQKDRPNPITLMLPGKPEAGVASVHVMDAVTGVEVARLDDIRMAIAL
jgi:hypothetical protein